MVPMLQTMVVDPEHVAPCEAFVDTSDTPGGRTSVTTTPVATDGPELVTITVYVMLFPNKTGSGETVLVTERSETGFTVIVADAESFDEFVSVSLAVTVTLLTRLPLLMLLTTIVVVALELALIVPRLHVTVEEPLQLPCVEDDDT